VLVLYTDGVTEAPNRQMEEFGLRRLMELLARCGGLDAAGCLQHILEAVGGFTGDAAAFDDITLVVIRRTEEGL
jgi:sigma-B regulation protein RsbU (phosphoserine phosphatase)